MLSTKTEGTLRGARQERVPGRLISVTIDGFKTFRDPCNVLLESLFTSVVGPNGAGKSSVIDAICFVFGSKTQDLRGSNLSSLINEELVGVAQSCAISSSVTVHLQGNDSHDHRVSRTIHLSASGKTTSSTYYVDGAKAMQIEVEDFLLTLGIDMKHPSRFILLQSRSLGIVRNSPTQLLAYLEEIIGTAELRGGIDSKREQEASLQMTMDGHEQQIAFSFQCF